MVTYLAGAGLNSNRTLTINGTTYDLTANRTWTLTTANISEVTNLYYTDARARAAISVTGSGSYNSSTGVITVTGGVTSVNTLTGAVVLTTTNIAEGTNLYYTSARANADFDTRLATKSTTNLSEGTNLYYTDTRVGTYLTTNSYATQTYVGTQIANLVASAPSTLDTLNELAAALGNDPSFATTIATSIGTKEPAITAGTTSQYWRGDKSWQTLPVYTLSGLGGVPTTRTITINGTALDLSADRSFTIAGGVTSFNTRTGAITPTSGDYTTALVTESGNLYYTDARARLALSGSTGISYNNTTGAISSTITQYTDTLARASISLSTTGTSGAATYDSATGVLNIPQYQGGVTSFNTRTGAITLSSLDVTTALTYTPVTNARTITINGTSYDLSANRSWTIAPDVSVRNTYAFTATAAQTTFTVTGGYSVGLVDVFINGVKLAAADFTATNGTTVVLGTGTGVGNIVEIVKYVSAFTTAVETTRTLTINGTTYDLSANRTWSIDNASLGAQAQLNGTGLVRMSGTTVSYDNATYATQSYVTTAVANLVNSAPSTLDTLNELATALGNDANFATTITTSIGTKQPQLNGTGFVKISGTTISYDNSTYLTTASASSTYQTILTNPITGSGTATRVAFFDGTNSVTSSSGFYWDNVNGRVAIGKNSADARLEVYGSTKGQIRVNGGTAMGAGIDFYTELSGANRRNWAIFTEDVVDGDFTIKRSATAGAIPTIQTLSCNKDGEVFVYHYFNIRNADQTVMYFNNTDRVGGAGRLWSILNGNLAAGIFSIKDETAAANRFSIATDGVATTYISALIGIATDASAYMRISENQIWRTGAGALYINNSGTGQVIIATGGGALTLGTDTQVGTNFITTKNAGITGSNTYFGTGQVRIGGGADHATNTVLSVAPGVVNFDRPGVTGGAYRIDSVGKSYFGRPTIVSAGAIEEFAFGVNSVSSFAFGSTNGKRSVIFAHETIGDSGLQFGWDTVDKTGIIAGSATSVGAGIDFYAYDGSTWANRMRMTKTGVLGIGVNPSSSDWGTRSAIMLGGYGTALSSYNGGGGATELLHNAVVTSGFSYKYGITAASTKQYMDGNNIIWFRAPIGTAGAAITYTELMNISSSGLGINTSGNSNLRLTVSEAGSTISGGDITFASQAKGIELYNQNSGTTDNLVGLWLSTGPHKAGIASGRTNAASNWAVDLRFFVHGTEIANLDHTYEKMRLYGDGGLTINGSLTQTGSLSDITLKENLVKIITPLQKISQISGYTFTWKENAPARQHISNIVEDAGLIAQEVELILPEIVRTNGDGSKALNYNGVVGLLVEAIKELKAEIDILKAR